VRASDEDREQTAGRVRHAAAEGRLLADELEQRLDAVFSARTYGGLDASVGDERSRIQRRDPRSGALITQTRPIISVSKPFIGGIDGKSTWLSVAGGMAGAYSHLNTTTLRTEAIGAPFEQYTNGVEAQIYDRILWVTQPAGGPERNFCANPVSGRPRARLHIGQGGRIVAADSHYIYDALYASDPAELVQAPIPPRCRH
jgi:Domain of unknown function (DUF1707)